MKRGIAHGIETLETLSASARLAGIEEKCVNLE